MLLQFRYSIGLAALLPALFLSACSRDTPVEPVAPAPLARVGDTVITEDDVAFEYERRREFGRPTGEPETVLRELVEREMMLQQARQSDLFEDPGVRRDMENQMLVRWLDHALQREKDQVRVSDEELRTYYEDRLEEFARPALSRLAVLYRRLEPGATEETRNERIAALEEARAEYLRDPASATQGGRLQGFGVLSARTSEDAASRYRGGDLGWLEETRAEHRIPERVLRTGFDLDVGAVSGVLAEDDGVYVVMKTGHRDAQVIPFEEAAPTLRRRALRDKQEAVERDFMARLYASADIEINEEKAARLPAPPQGAQPYPPDLSPLPEGLPGGAIR